MNNVALIGRLTKDPVLRQGTTAVTRFTVAVDKRVKAEGQPTADFISCVAFGKSAEFINKYFAKGNRIGIVGHIQTGSFTDKEGKTVYTTDVIADSVEFVESKPAQPAAAPQAPAQEAPFQAAADEGFMRIPSDLADEGLPFN